MINLSLGWRMRPSIVRRSVILSQGSSIYSQSRVETYEMPITSSEQCCQHQMQISIEYFDANAKCKWLNSIDISSLKTIEKQHAGSEFMLWLLVQNCWSNTDHQFLWACGTNLQWQISCIRNQNLAYKHKVGYTGRKWHPSFKATTEIEC